MTMARCKVIHSLVSRARLSPYGLSVSVGLRNRSHGTVSYDILLNTNNIHVSIK